jgi:transposase-like protein
MKPIKIRREAKADKWRGIVERHKQSGLSINEFCKQEEIKRHQFFYWQRRLASKGVKRADGSSFVRVKREPVSADDRIKISLSGGLTLECAELPDPEWLKALIT